MIGVRLCAWDPSKQKRLGILFGSCYAPVSSASTDVWDAYYADVTQLLSHQHAGDVVVLCTDGNASIGCGQLDGSTRTRSSSVGPFGLPHLNNSGRRLRCFLETNALASLASFYRKPYYGTWMHPASRKMHQLDHLVVSRADVFRFTNAGSVCGQLIDSDHRAIGGKLRVALRLQKKQSDSRGKLTRLDYGSLRGQDAWRARRSFGNSVLRHLGLPPSLPPPLPSPPPLPPSSQLLPPSPLLPPPSSPSPSPSPPSSPSSPSVRLTPSPWEDMREDAWMTIEAEYAAVLAEPLYEQLDYGTIADALQAAATSMLPERQRSQLPWFAAKEDELRARIQARNAALDALHRQPGSQHCRELLSDERTKLRAAVRAAKSEWIHDKCMGVNDGMSGTTSAKAGWGNVKQLRAGLAPPRRSAPAKMKKADGSLADTPDENATVFADSFEKLYGRTPAVDLSVLDALPQLAAMIGLDHDPLDGEIRSALRKLHDTAPGDSGLPAAVWKALGETGESFALVKQIVHAFWSSEEMPTEWETGLLSILFKKGSKSDPNNYRGIMMLEVAYKIVANIIRARLNPLIEALDHESQCGFRIERGTSDGIFTVKQAINKRREHGLETWVLFLDLVKAFDRVPRCADKTIERNENDPAEAAKDDELGMLWRVMLKFGVPTKLVRLLIVMHKKVDVDVDGVTKVLSSIIGVKQGDLLGPILFTFYIAAIMITWRAEHSYEACLYRSRPDHRMTGRRPTTGSAADELTIIDSEYADDTGMPFPSRKILEEQAPKVYAHFERWGMEIHAGIVEPRKDSKTEVLFCAAPRRCYTNGTTFDDADLSDILLPGGLFFSIVSVFKYLGSYTSSDGSDLHDVDSRIEAAGKAFGALSACLFRQTAVTAAAKCTVYKVEILAILLYGCECWLVTAEALRRLRCFHARCIRVMCGTSRVDTWRQRLSTTALEQRLGLEPIDTYVYRRQLRWLGHVSRMSQERLPRRMLSCWVAAPRPAGGQLMTYGRSVSKAMAYFNIQFDTWPVLAANRASWRGAIHGELLAAGRPRRAAASETLRRIDATLAEQRKPLDAPLVRPRPALRDITNLPAALQ